jgi:hypothetical protein
MSKKFSYPSWEPTSIQQITKEFMHQFYSVNLKAGKCTEADVDAFLQAVKAGHDKYPEKPMSAYAHYRRWFAEQNYKHLTVKKESKQTDETFFASIKKNIQQGQ